MVTRNGNRSKRTELMMERKVWSKWRDCTSNLHQNSCISNSCWWTSYSGEWRSSELFLACVVMRDKYSLLFMQTTFLCACDSAILIPCMNGGDQFNFTEVNCGETHTPHTFSLTYEHFIKWCCYNEKMVDEMTQKNFHRLRKPPKSKQKHKK